MTGDLRTLLEDLADQAPEVGDIDRAIAEAARRGRIRTRLTMIENRLPTVETAEGSEDVPRQAGRDNRRLRILLGAAAAAVLAITTSAVLLSRHNGHDVEPAQKPDTTTFRSALYGYSIALPRHDPPPVRAGAWKGHPATEYADDPTSTEQKALDTIHVPGTDTTISIEGIYLGRRTYANWATAYHRGVLKDSEVPSGCDGGDPSEWRRIPIGSAEGYLLQKCNQALGIVPVGKRVYLFIWGNRTFVEGDHYPQSRFEKLLAGVRLPDAATALGPLWTPSSSNGG
jgi:hypothetical protein